MKRFICFMLMALICLPGMALASERIFKLGSTGDDVRAFQQRLVDLGYLSDTPTGTYDSNTRAAVKLVQKANGLSSSGTADIRTQQRVWAADCMTQAQYDATRRLSSGDSGESVLILQRQLNQLGYYTAAPSGKFDSATRKAVKLFQEANGLKQSGIATEEMRKILNAGKGISAADYDKVRPLKYGNTGAAVTLLQTQLKELGYYMAALNAKYDSATRTAVKTFQAANGLKTSGTADSATRTKLNTGKCVTAAQYNKICEVKSGSKGEAVAELQRQLTAVQFYDGSIDGVYSTDVKNAVKAFQTANNLKATGKADTATRQCMMSSTCVKGDTYNLVCALKSGNSGVAVKVLQRQLQELGYYTGAIDGKYSSSLKTAVKTFQTANGLKETGTADVKTRAVIASGSAVTAAQYDRVRPLKSGNKGNAVKLLQEQLKMLGYYAGPLDANYSSALKSAVKTYQTANNLKVTGTADANTRNLLNSGKGINAAQYDKVRPLSSGNTGEAVSMVQRQLSELGYYVYAINGKYDSNTRKAVSVFQTANGMKASGKADVSVRTLLNSGRCASRLDYDADRTLKKGDLGSTVLIMQNRLIQLGYFHDVADGRFESSTRTAVKLFQTAHDMKDTGYADVEMRAKLFSTQAISYAEYQKICPIKSGESGEAVKQVQQQLANLGYYTGAKNGKYSSDMKNAVKLFEKANNLPSSSKISTDMRRMLNEGKCISLTTYYNTVELSRGDRSEAVKVLHKRLSELGYYTGKISNHYDSTTEKAVKLFQKANLLLDTGKADAKTRQVMNSSSAVTKEEYDRMQNGTSSDSNSSQIERLISVAKSKLGCKYVHATHGPTTFDCSGFTKYCFAQVGVELSSASYNQGYLDKLGGTPYKKKLMTYAELKRGDLLVFDTVKDDSDLSDHLGIYLGDGTFIHCSSSKGEVIISDLVRYGNFSWAFRLL